MDEAGATVRARSGWWRRHRLALLIGAMVFLGGAYFKHAIEYDNTRSRLFTATSLVERNTWNIDPWRDRTIDVSRGDDHYYSNKAIGLNLFAWPAHELLRALTPIGDARPLELTLLEMYLLQILGATLPHALAAVLVLLLAMRWGASPRHGVFVALAYGFGTIGWQHATMFSSHTLSAGLAVLGLYLAVRLRDAIAGQQALPRQLALALGGGLALGGATLTEYPVAVIALMLTIYLATLRPRWQVLAMWIGGGALMAAVLMWYNWAHFGSPLALSYGNQATDTFSEGSAQGLMGVALPSPVNLFHLIFTPARGLLAISPVLILMIPGAVALWRRRELRREWWVLVLAVVIFHVWNAGFYGWHSGWAYGSRYQVAILPLAALLLAFAPRLGWLGWSLLGVSILQNLLPVAGMPYPPQEFANPLVEAIVPLMGHGYWAVNLGQLLGMTGWLSLVPLLLILLAAGELLRRWTTPPAPEPTAAPQPARRRWWQALALGWLAIVLIMLALVRTPDTGMVHTLRARLLRDIWVHTGYEGYRQAAQREFLLGNPDFVPPGQEPPQTP